MTNEKLKEIKADAEALYPLPHPELEGSRMNYSKEDERAAYIAGRTDESEKAEALEKRVKELEEDKDLFAMQYAIWLKGAEGQMYEATGISAYALLNKYKDRPFINTFNPEQQ